MAQQLNNSVARAFAILRLLGRGRPRITVAEVSAELEINAITAHRFLKTLEAEGALVQVSKGSYRLGYALVDLGDRANPYSDCGSGLRSGLLRFAFKVSMQRDAREGCQEEQKKGPSYMQGLHYRPPGAGAVHRLLPGIIGQGLAAFFPLVPAKCLGVNSPSASE